MIAGDLGHWSEAEAVHREILGAERCVLGEGHPNVLAAQHNVALAIGQQGRWAEAETALREVLEAERHRLGRGHPGTQHTRNTLAWAVREQGRWAEVEAIKREIRDAAPRPAGPPVAKVHLPRLSREQKQALLDLMPLPHMRPPAAFRRRNDTLDPTPQSGR